MAHIPARWKNLAISRGDGEQEREAKRARIEAPPEARGVLTEAVDAAFQKFLAVYGNGGAITRRAATSSRT